MKKIKLSLLFLSICSLSTYAQSTVPANFERILSTDNKPVVFDRSVTNSVQNVGDKDAATYTKNQTEITVIGNSKISSVNGVAGVFQGAPIESAQISQQVYVRRTKLDTPIDFTNGIQEKYQRKTSQDIPMDFSNGVVEQYVRKQLPSADDQKVQKENPLAIDKNSSVYSDPAKTSPKPVALDVNMPSSITESVNLKKSTKQDQSSSNSSGKSSIE